MANATAASAGGAAVAAATGDAVATGETIPTIEATPTGECTAAGDRLRIGEAAQRTGVSERTLRYYEEIGLLVPAGHSAGGNREYGQAELARVLQIRELQELIGLNLEEIKSVVTREDRLGTIRDAYQRSDDPEERHVLLLEALEVTEALHTRVAAKVARIGEFRDQLSERIERYRKLLMELETMEPRPHVVKPAAAERGQVPR